jgi:hypothetical protein
MRLFAVIAAILTAFLVADVVYNGVAECICIIMAAWLYLGIVTPVTGINALASREDALDVVGSIAS